MFPCKSALAGKALRDPPTMKFLRIFLLLFVWTGFAVPAIGHQVESVEFEFQNLDEHWRLLGEMDIAYMLPETRKVPGGLPLSREATMKAPPEELQRIRRETENTLRSLMRITFAEKDIAWKIEFPDFEKQPFTLPEEAADWALISTRVVMEKQSAPGELKIHWSGEEESELIILTEDGEEGKLVSVLPGNTVTLAKVEASGESVEVKQSSALSWILSGFHHVVPLGLDHMLFIIGLFLMVPQWKPLLKQSLMFTLAHSVTLVLSILGFISLPSKLVEILIAFSIAFIGVENLVSKKVGKLRLGLVLAFGLIHGMGFASVLAEKLEGIPQELLTVPLVSFNVGVELAQITVLCVAFLVFWPLRKWENKVQVVGSVLVTCAGLGWMIERIFLG
ncbi:MAG: HupE/UreJ family protein [Akkermansiaceae bacterium]|nr:HupE/UreJ family protein [Akkermansiaceae bacterium]